MPYRAARQSKGQDNTSLARQARQNKWQDRQDNKNSKLKIKKQRS